MSKNGIWDKETSLLGHSACERRETYGSRNSGKMETGREGILGVTPPFFHPQFLLSFPFGGGVSRITHSGFSSFM